MEKKQKETARNGKKQKEMGNGKTNCIVFVLTLIEAQWTKQENKQTYIYIFSFLSFLYLFILG